MIVDKVQNAKRKVQSLWNVVAQAKAVPGKFSIFNFQFSILLLLSTLLLQGCLTHWIVDGEVRMQIENRSDVAIAAFSVVDRMGNRSVWVPDTLWPGEKSQVYADEWVGNFRLGLSARDSVDAWGDSCWRFVELGTFDLEGGSSLARIRRSAGSWSLEVK